MDLDTLKELLGNDNIQTYQARLVRTVRDTVNPELKQVSMGVIGISKDQHDTDFEGWEGVHCDIIVIPKKLYKCDKSIELMRIDMAMGTLSDDKSWTEKLINKVEGEDMNKQILKEADKYLCLDDKTILETVNLIIADYNESGDKMLDWVDDVQIIEQFEHTFSIRVFLNLIGIKCEVNEKIELLK